MWDVERSQAVARLTGHTDSILSVRWSALGRTLLSCSKDRFVHAYDPRAAPHAPIARVCAHDSTLPSRVQWLNDASAGSDSHLFVTAGYNKARALCVALWDMRALSSSSSASSSSSSASAEPLFVRQVPVGGNNCVGAPMLAWSAPHRMLTVAHKGDKHLYFFDLATASASAAPVEPHIYYLNQFASDQQQLGFAGRFTAPDASSGGAIDGHSELLRVFQIFEDRGVNVLRVTRSALAAAKDASAAALAASPPSAAATASAHSQVDPAAALVTGEAASRSDPPGPAPAAASANASDASIAAATVVAAWDEEAEAAYETRRFSVRESVAALPRMLRQSTIFDLAPIPVASSVSHDQDAVQVAVESARTVRFDISPALATTSDVCPTLAETIALPADNDAAAGDRADTNADSSALAAVPSSESSSITPPSDALAFDPTSIAPSSSSCSLPASSESSPPSSANAPDLADNTSTISENDGDDPPPPAHLPQIPPELLASIHKGCELRRVIIIHSRDPSSTMPAFAAPAPPPMPASLLRSIGAAASTPLRPAAESRVVESNVAKNAFSTASASSLSLSPVAPDSLSTSSPMASVSASPTPLQQQQLFEQVETRNHQQMQQLQTHARLSALERAAAAHRADVERLERENAALRTQNRILAEAGGVGGGLIVAPVQWPSLPPNVARRVVTSAEDEPKGHFAIIARQSVLVKPAAESGGGASASGGVRAMFLSSRALPTDAPAVPSAGSASAPESVSSRGSVAASGPNAAVAPILLMDPRRTQLSQFSRLHQLVYLRSAWPHF